VLAKGGDQLLVDDLDDLLGRGEAPGHLLADRPLPHPANEVLDHPEIDVGFEQGEPHLAQGRVDLRLGQPPMPSELGEDVLEAVGERVEHVALSDRGGEALEPG
jgi:hypothetical protein